jgi:hypothetical protein
MDRLKKRCNHQLSFNSFDKLLKSTYNRLGCQVMSPPLGDYHHLASYNHSQLRYSYPLPVFCAVIFQYH